jgi:hypothetical protein
MRERKTFGEYKLEVIQGREGGGNLIKFQNTFINGKT